MPCYFLNKGLEMQMPNETFDLLWNNCPNAELTDSETSSSFGEGDKVTSSVEKKRKYWMEKAGRRILKRQAERQQLLQEVLPREDETAPCMRRIRFSILSCRSSLAKHRRTKKCQKFLV